MRGDKGTADKHADIIVAALQCTFRLSMIVLFSALTVSGVQAFDWVPSDEEIQRYRKTWNPMANGPILISGVDIQPKGQFLFQPFVFGEIGHEKFGNSSFPKSQENSIVRRLSWIHARA